MSENEGPVYSMLTGKPCGYLLFTCAYNSNLNENSWGSPTSYMDGCECPLNFDPPPDTDNPCPAVGQQYYMNAYCQ